MLNKGPDESPFSIQSGAAAWRRAPPTSLRAIALGRVIDTALDCSAHELDGHPFALTYALLFGFRDDLELGLPLAVVTTLMAVLCLVAFLPS